MYLFVNGSQEHWRLHVKFGIREKRVIPVIVIIQSELQKGSITKQILVLVLLVLCWLVSSQPMEALALRAMLMRECMFKDQYDFSFFRRMKAGL